MRISDWSSDVCSSDLPTLKTRYGLVRTLAYGGTAESFAEARRELEATDRLAGDRLRDENEVALYAAIARGQFHFQQLQVEPALEAHLRADPDLLRRLLTLLLDHAAKFTPAGKVLLGCRRFGGGVRIEVRDSGPGIAEKQAAQVFEPFFRLENEVRPRERGLGLDLAYARRLAELAGDSLTLTGRPGRGCCFAVALQPAGQLAGGRSEEHTSELQSLMRISYAV